MKSALIGYTGFVGGNLALCHDFSHQYNSKNIQDIRGESFDIVYCAGVQARVWWANQNPVEDRQAIDDLLDHLKTINAERFVLISTVDVYPNPRAVDESTDLSDIENVPYGVNRLYVEDFVHNHFEHSHVLRLPGLFGPGIKKNVIYDLMNDNYLHALNDQGVFQYYDLRSLYDDVQTIIKHEIPVMNMATEPIVVKELIENFFPEAEYGSEPGPLKHYDFYTKYAAHWGQEGPYIQDKEEVLRRLEDFIGHAKKESRS